MQNNSVSLSHLQPPLKAENNLKPISNSTSMATSPLFLFFLLILPSPSSSATSNSITSFTKSISPWTPSQNLTLLSPNSTFASGFLSINTSPPSYAFSIWYSFDKTAVWSTSPITATGSLSITSSGQLILRRTSSGPNLWPNSSLATGSANTTSLRLSDLGNLQFGRWSSFDFPTNTFLPNQTLNGTQLVSNNNKFQFLGLINLTFNSSATYYTASNAFQQFTIDGIITITGGQLLSADFKENRSRRLVLDDDGNLRVYSFYPNREPKWMVVWKAVQEICVIQGLCGTNAICMEQSGSDTRISCSCPPGYKWVSGSDSCAIKRPVMDQAKSKFLRLDYVNFTAETIVAANVTNLVECESRCRADSSCLGFGFKYDGTRYCALQLGTRLLNGHWSPGTQSAMFLKVDGLEIDVSNYTGMTFVLETTCPVRIGLPDPPDASRTEARNIAIVVMLFALELVIGVLSFWAFGKKYVKYRDMARTLGLELLPTGGPRRFSYADIKAATNDFSSGNMIGRGGFSDVYKGELRDGRVVAIKCLKNVSGGDADFWDEVTIIARMHHLNLVRLWGFCNEKEHRILVYEHVSNGSLDKSLFVSSRAQDLSIIDGSGTTSESQKPVLDWNIRYRIALGVARAIAYLHEECLEWVLHCDIKPENILLGDDFCPKVADFGLSKLKKKEQVVSMSRIRGTRGYVAPEWVKNEPISSKADVYSFGMVLLEMVTGTRTFVMQDSEMDSSEWYLPRWAYDKVYKEMKIEDVLDNRIKQTFDENLHLKMVDRMVKTAMWCIQEKPEMRPSMGRVAKMLEGTVEIMEPPKPTIFYITDE